MIGQCGEVQAPSPAPPRILVVDDEPLICAVAVDWLTDAGYPSEEATSAGEALAKLHDMPFDAAIIDIGLPDRPGGDLVAEIRSLWPNLPIAVASGYDAAELTGRFGIDPLIPTIAKPYDRRALEQALATLGVKPASQG